MDSQTEDGLLSLTVYFPPLSRDAFIAKFSWLSARETTFLLLRFLPTTRRRLIGDVLLLLISVKVILAWESVGRSRGMMMEGGREGGMVRDMSEGGEDKCSTTTCFAMI